MKMSVADLIVFPTQLAKRQYEHRALESAGALATARLFTQKQLLTECEKAARKAKLLTGEKPSPLRERLTAEKTVQHIRTGWMPNNPLAALSDGALARVLEKAVNRFSAFGENAVHITDCLLNHPPAHKLHGIGQLYRAWNTACDAEGLADRRAVNAAILRLLDGPNEALPSCLRDLEGNILFRAVRWLNPLDEQVVAKLKQRFSDVRVQVFSTLPPVKADETETRLDACVRSELMRGTEEQWQGWLEELGDAVEVKDSNLVTDEARERVSFFTSAGAYGEIEDAARRIAIEIERGTPPHRIALILRDLGAYTDIVPDVFQRFGLPYYFRRGRPLLSLPAVKTFLALLAFPLRFERDRLCDLLQSPALHWPEHNTGECRELAQRIRTNASPRMETREELKIEFALFRKWERAGSPAEAAAQAIHAIQHFKLDLPPRIIEILESFTAQRSVHTSLTRFLDLFEELLTNETLTDENSTESGVWVLNPMDAAGLRFDTVFIAGLDDHTFPQIPQADTLLSKPERFRLRKTLEKEGVPCPRLSLSESGLQLLQEEILFLTAMSTARERLTLSYAALNADGREQAPGEFFEKLRLVAAADEPKRGESFRIILPPEACRAEDEALQSAICKPDGLDGSGKSNKDLEPVLLAAKIERDRKSEYAGVLSRAKARAHISTWLETHDEFSPTALEVLARNRYVFFLEKILGIKPDRTHEDDTDPMDRGTIVHDVLEQVYAAIAERSALYATPNVDAVSSPHSQPKRNAMGTSRLRWRISQQKIENSIPLAVFDPAKTDELLALTRDIADEEFAKAERRSSHHLGHPAVWKTEKCKLHQVIENFIRMDLETALKENRYPALFEMKFDEKHDLPVTLHYTQGSVRESCIEDGTIPRTDPIRFVEEVRLKGKIDRIDLIFDDDGELKQLLVVDYKGKSRTDSIETLEKKIGLNLDCQLALYTFAAQQKFFGAHNVPELNEKVQAVYHLQERDLKKMTNHFSKRRLTMNPELTDAFLETLFSNVWKLRAGDLATAPLIAGYDDYSHICRTTAIDPKELLK